MRIARISGAKVVKSMRRTKRNDSFFCSVCAPHAMFGILLQKNVRRDIQKSDISTLLACMRRFIASVTLAFLFLLPTLSQDTLNVHLKGRVVDENQDPVSLCIIRIEGQAIGTTASLDGQYTLNFRSADSVVVLYSMMGYEPRRRVLKKPQGNLTLNIVMHTASKEMSEVTVADTRRQMGSTQELNTRDLKRMPGTGS